MNYYEALERRDHRWDFTCTNDGHISPVGYCRAWRDWPDDMKALYAGADYAQYVRDVSKYHGGGHATKEEAELCYYTYLLDTRLKEVASGQDVQCRCAARKLQIQCDIFTQKGLSMGMSSTTWLCDTHRTREIYEKINPFHGGTQIISSY